MFLLLVAVLTTLIIILILPTIKEIIHRFVIVGVRARIFKSEADDGVSLDLP